MHHPLLQSGHLFLPLFPQSCVGTTAISMTFTLFSVAHSLALCSTIVMCGERLSSVITFKAVTQISLILVHSVTVWGPD